MNKEMPSWDKFKAKCPSEELQRARFEDLARCLFCRRFNIKYGISQCVNHAGNETDTIVVGEEIIGFQAKFFNNDIDEKQIIKSIHTAKERHQDQTKVIVYTNLDFGNPKKGKKVTSKQEKLEKEAKTLGLAIEWSTNNMILDQVASTDWIYDVFFGSEPNLYSLIKEESENVHSILALVKSQIQIGEKIYKFSRDQIISDLFKKIGPHKHFVLHGEGGIGKTALIKDFVEKYAKEMPICIRKALSLNVNSINDCFRFIHSYSLEQFEAAYQEEDRKVFVIDSAERIQDIEDIDPFRYLINFLDEKGWTVIFTVRNAYLYELSEELRCGAPIQCEYIALNELDENDLAKFFTVFSIKLPTKENLIKRLHNLFYLNLYALYCRDIKQGSSLETFMEKVWEQKIAGKKTINGIRIKRNICFSKIVEDRIKKDVFFLDSSGFDASAIQALINDEVISTIKGKEIFIAHDIYEEWGISRFISEKWKEKNSVSGFFSEIGSTYLIRRAFRQWLSDGIENNLDDVKMLLQVVKSKDVASFWQDEIIVSILQSSYCSKFLYDSKQELLKDHAFLLNRVIFLLQLACKRFDRIEINGENGEETPVYVPFGPGWPAVINFLYQQKVLNLDDCYLTNVVSDWCVFSQEGMTTRQAGLIALQLLKTKEESKKRRTGYLNDTNINSDKLFETVCDATIELKNELSRLISKVVKNEWNDMRDPYYYCFLRLLHDPLQYKHVIDIIPVKVMKLADCFWKQSSKKDSENMDRRNVYDMGEQLGISDSGFYDPAGAFQTPIYYLLYVNPLKTLKFIVDFVNYSIEHYDSQQPEGYKLDTVIVHLDDDKGVAQKGNASIWCLYRGEIITDELFDPGLLQSIHMALEKFLLDVIKKEDFALLKKMFDYILKNSQSVSLTAVIASIVVAYPVHLLEYAVILFDTIEFFYYDSIRKDREEDIGKDLSWQLETRIDNGDHQEYFETRVLEERTESKALKFRQRDLIDFFRFMYNRGATLPHDLSDMRYVAAVTIKFMLETILISHYERASSMPLAEKRKIEFCLFMLKCDDKKFELIRAHNHNKPYDSDFGEDRPNSSLNLSNNKAEIIELLNAWAKEQFLHYIAPGFKEHDGNPKKVIIYMKKVMENRIENGLQEDVLYAAAGVLICVYSHELSEEEMDYCIKLVDEKITSTLSQSDPINSDSIEYCIHAIPQLLFLFPENAEKYKHYLMSFLFDFNLTCSVHINDFYFVCDIVMDAIELNDLWNRNPSFMETLFNDYIVVSNFDAISNKAQQCLVNSISFFNTTQNGLNNTNLFGEDDKDPNGDSMTKCGLCLPHSSEHDYSVQMQRNRSVLCVEFEIVRVVLGLIRTSKKASNHFDIAEKIIPVIKCVLRVEAGFVDIDATFYGRVMRFYASFAYFVLRQSPNNINKLIKPFINDTDTMNSVDIHYFLHQFIVAERFSKKEKAFLQVWKMLYDVFIKTINKKGLIDQIAFTTYILYSTCLDDDQSWNTFENCITWLYDELTKEHGDNPNILYSLAGILVGKSDHIFEKSLDWLYIIVNQHPGLNLGENEEITITNLETIMNKYVRKNKMKIKRNKELRKKVVEILTFMVNRNSIQGYMLREMIA